jgi:uncharacterized protein YxjI
MAATDQILHQDQFLLRQRWAPVVNRYEFFLPGDDGQPGEAICFVEQKRFAFKEDIRFYADASKSREILRIKARQRFDPAARYDVTEPDGTRVGQIQKAFGSSLVRSTYVLYDEAGEEVARAQERSLFVAVFRRLIGVVPIIGGFTDWVPIPYHFEFKRGDQLLGIHYRQPFKFRDTYTIDLSFDADRTLDRRLVLATSVAMDALQAR